MVNAKKTSQDNLSKQGGARNKQPVSEPDKGGNKSVLDKNNRLFNTPEIKLAEREKANADFETKADLIANLDDEDFKRQETSQEIFRRLNSITYKKNQKNNQYLIDFNRWLLENLKKLNRGKEDVWYDLKRLYQQFTVHGQKSKTGILKNPDIDGAAGLLLLEIAGFKEKGNDNINFVSNGESGPGLNIDTDDKEDGKLRIQLKKLGIGKKGDSIVPQTTLFNSKLIVNEHGGGPCSSTRMIYQILNSFGKIPEEKKNQIKRFVEFVDIVDDLGYQAIRAVSPYMERCLFGLYKHLPIEFIFNYFKDPNKTGFEYLDDEYLELHEVKVVDFAYGKYIRKSLKKLSDEKKQRMERGYKEIDELISKGYFLILGKKRFIVDLGGKLTDGPEIVNIYTYGIIKIFTSGDLYIYSPDKLPENFGGFEVKNEHFIIDKVGSDNNINKLLNEFEYLPEREFEESTENGSKFNLKKEIVEYMDGLKKSKENLQQDKIPNKTIISMENQFSILPEIKLDDIEIGEDYKGVVNNIQGNIVFVTFDKYNKVRGILHKNDVEDLNIFKSIKTGDSLSVKIKEIIRDSENVKIKLILNKLITEEQNVDVMIA